MKRFCECHHPDCNICKICNKYEQHIAELETANKGLQIALLNANEKEKELQLRNAMIREGLELGADDYWRTLPENQKYFSATSAQSAA